MNWPSTEDPGDLYPDPPPDVPPPPDVGTDVERRPDVPRQPDVPRRLDVLPDGRATVVIGDVTGLSADVRQQGDNPYGFMGTCGLCACMYVLRGFGIPVTEADVVRHAVENGECAISDDPAKSGGTTPRMWVRLLGDYGVPAHVERMRSLEQLASRIEQGRGVIIGANAGVLWDDATSYEGGRVNHAVQVIGVSRDPTNGSIQGFYINDSGPGVGGRFVDAAIVDEAWLDRGGLAVVTDIVREVP